MAHKELGIERLAKICDDLSDVGKVELAPRWMGRQASIIIAPDKLKVDTLKRKMTKEQLAKEAEELAKLEAQNAAELEADQDDDDDDDQDARKNRKGPADDRAVNPVDDEIADLLSE